MQATDEPLVAGIFTGLSATSRWMRFLAAKAALSPAELRYLTDIDHHRFTALASADNAAVAALLRTIGAEPVRQEAGTVEYQITLTQRPDSNGRPATGLGKEAR
jgi:hypothetical protein